MEKTLVKVLCPRCDGNGYIKLLSSPGLVEYDCPQCEEAITHMGQRITTHNGYVMLPIEDTRKNIEGGHESKTKWSGETLPEVGKIHEQH